jgi:hypothetical protein
MTVTEPDGVIVCNKCQQHTAPSEQAAEAVGWSVDREADPPAHILPRLQASGAVAALSRSLGGS